MARSSTVDVAGDCQRSSIRHLVILAAGVTSKWSLGCTLLCLMVLLSAPSVKTQNASSEAMVMRGPCVREAGSSTFNCSTQAINADITLGGLFPVHLFSESSMSCQRTTVELENLQWVEAMRDAVDRINADTTVLNGVKLGYEIRDSCRRASVAVLECLQFIGQSTTDEQCAVAGFESGSRIQPSVVGVVGSFASSVSLRATELLGLFGIPMVSYGSTSPRLSNNRSFPFFFRTIPSDELAAQSIAKMIRTLQWDFVGLVHTSDVFGVDGAEMVAQALGLPSTCSDAGNSDTAITRICLSQSWEIVDGASRTHPIFKQIWEDILLSEPTRESSVIVMFTQEQETSFFFEYVLKTANATLRDAALLKNVTFIGVDAWGDIITAVQGAPSIAKGSVSAIPSAPRLVEFETHWTDLNPVRNSDNPWLSQLWQQAFNCVPSTTTPGNACSMQNSLRQNFSMSSKVPYVYHSVYAFAHALDRIYRGCGQNITCLRRNASVALQEEFTMGFAFKNIYGASFEFEADGDPAISEYDIKNMIVSSESQISFPTVGQYRGTATSAMSMNCSAGLRQVMSTFDNTMSVCLNESFSLNHSEVLWNSGSNQIPVSVCSAPCDPGYRRDFNGTTNCQSCCWVCVPCAKNSISTVANSDDCTWCLQTETSNENRTACVNTPFREFSVPSALPIVLVCAAAFGIVGVLAAFIKCLSKVNDSFFIFGREPTFFCLFGLLVTYISILLEAGGPSGGVCLARLVLATLGTTTLVSSILVFVLHRFTAAGKLFVGAILVHPLNRFVICIVLEAVTAALLILFCIDGECNEVMQMPNPAHEKVDVRCGFLQADIAVIIYLCIMSIAIFIFCIGTTIINKKKKLAPVIYDPNSRLFPLILVATGLSTLVAVCCLAVQTGSLSVQVEDAILHVVYWQLATAYFMMIFAQPIRKLGHLSKSEEIDYTETLEKETRGSRSLSMDMSTWAKSIAARARGSSTGKIERISTSPPLDEEVEMDVKSAASGSYKEAQEASVLPGMEVSPLGTPVKGSPSMSHGKNHIKLESYVTPDVGHLQVYNSDLHTPAIANGRSDSFRTETAM